MYFVEEMTQSAIADTLGVGRVTVVRMLAEAKALGEVRVALSRGDAELGGLEAGFPGDIGFSDAIVAPLSSEPPIRRRRSRGAWRLCFGAVAQ